MKKILFGIVLMFFCLTYVNAEYSLEKVFETELYERTDLDYYDERQKNFFVKDNVISVFHKLEFNDAEDIEVFDETYTFYKYDKKGKLIAKNEIKVKNTNNVYYSQYSINSMGQYEEFIYIFTNGEFDNEKGFLLLKVDSDLNVSIAKAFTVADITGDSTFSSNDLVTISDGRIIFALESYDEVTDTYPYKLNIFDLKTFENEIIDDDQLEKKYFPNIDYQYGVNNYKHTIYSDNEYTFYTDKSLEYANLIVSSEDKDDVIIENKDYIYFREGVVIDDYILLVANIEVNIPDDEDKIHYLFNGLNQKSDLLIYDINGNLKETISTNSHYGNLEVLGNEILLTRFYVDGICYDYGRYYSLKSECLTYTQRILFNFESDENVLSEKEEHENITNTKNPNTSTLSTISILLISLVLVIVFSISYRGLKNIN